MYAVEEEGTDRRRGFVDVRFYRTLQGGVLVMKEDKAELKGGTYSMGMGKPALWSVSIGISESWRRERTIAAHVRSGHFRQRDGREKTHCLNGLHSTTDTTIAAAHVRNRHTHMYLMRRLYDGSFRTILAYTAKMQNFIHHILHQSAGAPGAAKIEGNLR